MDFAEARTYDESTRRNTDRSASEIDEDMVDLRMAMDDLEIMKSIAPTLRQLGYSAGILSGASAAVQHS